MRRGWLAAACLLGALGSHAAAAADLGSRELEIPRIGAAAAPDSPLAGASAGAGELTEFRQFDPRDGEPCSRATSARVEYDDDNLYVTFTCLDEPGAIRAHLTRRDDISGDDQVSLYLDTFGDGQRAYVFACNPLGVQLDGIVAEGQDEDDRFDALWAAEGRLTATGFTVRMSIPFRSLRFSDDRVQTWRVALGRTIARFNEQSFWPFITGRLNGFVPQFATARGLYGISPGRNVQIIPYGISTRARFLDTESASPGFQSRDELRGGLDSKLVLRDAYTVDAALNPDFSQVESDEPQVTINQRFEVFYPERRPFFLENAGFFQTPLTLFFSRRIADPGWGLRLTGKSGRWVVGTVAADDRAPGRALPAGDPRAGERAWNGVLSLRREFGRESGAGLLATSRDFAGGLNRVLSLDTRLKLSPNWVFAGQATRSWTGLLDGSRLAGSGFVAEFSRSGRHVEDETRYTDLDPGFRSTLGFVKRVGIRKLEQELKYRWRPKRGPIVKFGPTLSGSSTTDHAGRPQDRSVGLEFKVEGPGHTELKLGRTAKIERFAGSDFHKVENQVELTSAWIPWLSYDAIYTVGTEINFDPAPGLEPFLANAQTATLTLSLRPSPRLSLDQTWLYSGLSERAESRASRSSIFDNGLLRWKLHYQFTRPLSLRAIVDYALVSPNPSRVELERERRIGVDLLATFLVSPGTALYAGVTDRRENLALDATTPPGLRRTDFAGLTTGRQFFLKASYLIRR